MKTFSGRIGDGKIDTQREKDLAVRGRRYYYGSRLQKEYKQTIIDLGVALETLGSVCTWNIKHMDKIKNGYCTNKVASSKVIYQTFGTKVWLPKLHTGIHLQF